MNLPISIVKELAGSLVHFQDQASNWTAINVDGIQK